MVHWQWAIYENAYYAEQRGLLGASEMSDRIFGRAVTDATMPPGGALGVDLRAILGEWVMAGAPRSAPEGGRP